MRGLISHWIPGLGCNKIQVTVNLRFKYRLVAGACDSSLSCTNPKSLANCFKGMHSQAQANLMAYSGCELALTDLPDLKSTSLFRAAKRP
eukprot:1160766-Pelagomonas_calceolata.AAC.14